MRVITAANSTHICMHTALGPRPDSFIVPGMFTPGALSLCSRSYIPTEYGKALNAQCQQCFLSQNRRPIGTITRRLWSLPPLQMACTFVKVPAAHHTTHLSHHSTYLCLTVFLTSNRSYLPIQIFGAVCIQLGASCQVS